MRFTTLLGCLFMGLCVYAGAAGQRWWDNRPLGQPAWANTKVLFWKPFAALAKPSLLAQRDVYEDWLGQSEANNSVLNAALTEQNDNIKRVEATADKATDAAKKAVAQRKADNTADDAMMLVLLKQPLPSGDECTRVTAAFEDMKRAVQ